MSTISLMAMSTPLVLMASSPPTIAVSVEPSERAMLAWLPGEVRCAGTVVIAERFERPLPSLSWGRATDLGSITYTFEIDKSGRTLGIRKLGNDARNRGAEDIAPSLAASRFLPGRAHSDCTMTYVARQENLRAAPISDLIAYSVNPVSGPMPKEGWQRINADGNCYDGRRLRLRTRAFPDFRSIPATPGVRDWSMVVYDIDANGVPRNTKTVAGTGNTALDTESRTAVEESRYYEGDLSGCRYPYWRTPATLPAPPAPEEESFRPEGASCPERRDWVVRPSLRFPEPYRRRAIEGWAVVTYDVAPWGEISNIKVAASQPTEEFGDQAVAVVRGAKVATTQGFVGCVDRVRFEMGPREETQAELD